MNALQQNECTDEVAPDRWVCSDMHRMFLRDCRFCGFSIVVVCKRRDFD
jgi:hypothetical protein